MFDSKNPVVTQIVHGGVTINAVSAWSCHGGYAHRCYKTQNSEHHIRSVSRSRVWYHNDHKEETNRESGQLQLVMHHLESVVVHFEVIHRVSMKSS